MSFDYFADDPGPGGEADLPGDGELAPGLLAAPDIMPQEWRQVRAKPLPHNLEAEQALLGAVMFENNLLHRLPEGLDGPHFYEPFHQRLWAAMTTTIRRGDMAEPTLLMSQFAEDPAFEAFGGLRYLADLVDRAPPSFSAPQYAREVYDLGIKRQLMRAAAEVFWACHVPETSARDQIEFAERSLLTIRPAETEGARVYSAEEAVQLVVDHMDATDAELGAVKTGLAPLDNALGYLLPGEMTLLGGRPGMGKSTLEGAICLNVAWPEFRLLDPSLDDHQRFALRQGMPAPLGVLKISGEMAVKQMTWRMLADVAFMLYGAAAPTYSRIKKRTLTPDQRAMIDEAARLFKNIPLRQLKRTGLKVSGLRSLARREQARFARLGLKLGLITVDHAGLIEPDDRSFGEYQGQSQIAKDLKALAGELEIPIIPLIQLSRKVEERDDKRPQLADLRASGQWEENADAVMLCYREAYYARKEKEPVDNGAAGAMLKWSDWDKRRKSPDLDVLLPKTRDDEGGEVKLWSAIGHHAVRGMEPAFTGGLDFSSHIHPNDTDRSHL